MTRATSMKGATVRKKGPSDKGSKGKKEKKKTDFRTDSYYFYLSTQNNKKALEEIHNNKANIKNYLVATATGTSGGCGGEENTRSLVNPSRPEGKRVV